MGYPDRGRDPQDWFQSKSPSLDNEAVSGQQADRIEEVSSFLTSVPIKGFFVDSSVLSFYFNKFRLGTELARATIYNLIVGSAKTRPPRRSYIDLSDVTHYVLKIGGFNLRDELVSNESGQPNPSRMFRSCSAVHPFEKIYRRKVLLAMRPYSSFEPKEVKHVVQNRWVLIRTSYEKRNLSNK